MKGYAKARHGEKELERRRETNHIHHIKLLKKHIISKDK